MHSRVATERSAGAMRSPVNWALLGIVIQRPSYGYELVQRFERTYGGALELSSPSQIYTALDTLARRSLIEEVPAEEVQDAIVRQPKPHYRVTAEGLRAYEEWLVNELGEDRRRSRLFALELAVLAPEAALGVIERYEQACLKEATGLPMVPAAEDADGAGGLVARLLREEDRLAVEARLAWIEYARRELTSLTSRPTTPR
jgi:DNA-binding PadR family transcriptional regulator